MADNLTTIRRRVAAKVTHMSAEQALSKLADIRKVGSTIHIAPIRDLTGGYCSQALNTWVIRKLAVRAGMIPRG